MSERRLINKKAYEELVLLKKYCDKESDDEFRLVPGLEINDEGREMFVVRGYTGPIYVESLEGRNYAEIMKRLVKFIDE